MNKSLGGLFIFVFQLAFVESKSFYDSKWPIGAGAYISPVSVRSVKRMRAINFPWTDTNPSQASSAEQKLVLILQTP